MRSLSAASQFLLLTFAGWVNRRQRDVVVYLQDENRILREQLGRRRLRLTDALAPLVSSASTSSS